MKPSVGGKHRRLASSAAELNCVSESGPASARRVISSQEAVELHFPGDDLFEPYRRRRGLPIGNLTSQFSANLYLDRFDHRVTEVLGAPYVRYVDDFALFHDDPAVLADWRHASITILKVAASNSTHGKR